MAGPGPAPVVVHGLGDWIPVTAPAPERAPVPVPESCTVDGQPVLELSALVVPAAYFVSPSSGTAEITRIYYHDGKYTSAYATARLGDATVVGAHYSADTGLLVVLTGGYRVRIPAARVQASWRVTN